MNASSGTFTFRWPSGDEVFAFESANLVVTHQDDTFQIVFYARAAEGAVKAVAETAERSASLSPNAEVIVVVKGFDPDDLVGQRFLVPLAYDPVQKEHLATVYFGIHEDLNENIVDVVDRDGDNFKVRWTATAPDLGEHAVPVLIEGWFNLEKRF